MRLYHYSNTDIKDKIKVNYYGINFFTRNDTKITNIRRSFFYTRPEPEFLLKNCKFLYIVDIDNSKIYDLTYDVDRLKKRYYFISGILNSIIKKGYLGCKYRIGNLEIVNLFYDVKIKDKIILTK